MIGYMRKIAPVVMWVVIIAFIGTIFFAWGMDYTRSSKISQNVGQIGNENITYKQFARAVEMERERLRSSSETELNSQQEQMIPRQVWEREVSMVLHKKIIKDMALEGSPDEVFEYIKKNPPPQVLQVPQFQTDSVFDTAKFVQFLNTPASYDNQGMVELEVYTKNLIIPMEKLKMLIERGVVSTREQIEQEYRAEKERIVFEFAKVIPTVFSVDSAQITQAAIKSYYDNNQKKFMSDEQADLYYVKLIKNATPADEQAYLKELIDIKTRIEKKETTFEEEAKIESDDEGSAQNGGELGWFSRGQMVKEFEEAAFALKPGEISMPIKTPYGYHLISIEEQEMSSVADTTAAVATKKGKKGETAKVSAPQIVSRIKARHILRKIKPSAETLDSLNSLAESVRDQIIEKGFKAGVAGFKDIIVDSTGLFKKGDRIPGIGYLPSAMQYAFMPKEMMKEENLVVSEKLENDLAIYLLALKRKTVKGLLPLADVTDKIRATLHDSMQSMNAQKYLEEIRTSLTADQSLATLKAKDTTRIVSAVTDTVSRKQYVPDVGYDNPVVTAALTLPIGTVSKVIKADRSFFLVRPLWKHTLDSIPSNDPDVTRLQEQVLNQQRQNAYMEWYTSFKNNLKVTENLADYFN
ncbi:MAG: peptidylprolyl isomerase [Chitinivibrionales bacterium]|nr:peptidylprolyl isomerase [Chitinivibrionales bacterium]